MLNAFFDIPQEHMEKVYPIIDAIPVSVYWKDRDGKYLGCNQYVLDMANKKNREEIIGKTDFELPWKDSADALRKIDLHVMSTGDIYETEETSTLVDHSQKIFLTTKKPFYDSHKNIVGLIGISVDITSRKKAEELRIKHETAEKVIAFAKLMAGSMAHEIRTPLGVIGSRIDVLKITFEELELNDEVKKTFLNEYRTIKRTIDDGMHTVKTCCLN
jgi:two-component system aerobic respiration control sensor histidine kinase ArcB